MAVHVVARHTQSTGHHHTFDGAPAAVLGARRAAIIPVRFQLRGKQSTHLCHVLVFIHVAVPLITTQLPLSGADGRRTRPVAGGGR